MDHLRGERRLADGRGRMPYLRLHEGRAPPYLVGEALRAEAEIDHERLDQLDLRGILGVQELHRRPRSYIDPALAKLREEVPHRDRDVAEVDVDRAGRFALVAHRAMVGDVAVLVEVPDGHAPARLLLVEERLGEQ